MMRVYRGIGVVLVMVLAGCGGLHELWEGPSAATFKPKSIAALPPIVGAYEGAREASITAIVTRLTKSGRYEKVVSMEEVNAAFGSKEGSDLLAAYYSKLETTGQSDPEMAVKIGKLVQADALLVAKINHWEFGRAEGDSFGKVGMGMRLIDASNGSLVWKGRHDKLKTFMIFKPKLKDIADDLTEDMLNYLPK